MTQLSIIVPTFNEEHWIEHTLQAIKQAAPDAELLVVDGESTDHTVERASKYAEVIRTQRGRGRQLNVGAQLTTGAMLLFLHADTLVDEEGITELLSVMQDKDVLGGAFRMRFDVQTPLYQRIGKNVAQRSLHTKSYTGDQGIFTSRECFAQLNGYKNWLFMEDVDYSERMGKAGRVVLLNHEVETSARRHQRWGLLRTQLTVVLIRMLYLLRMPPDWYEWLWSPVR